MLLLWANGNQGVFRIPQMSSITEASPSDCSVSYVGRSLGESYLSAKLLLAYSAALANWAMVSLIKTFGLSLIHPSFFGFFLDYQDFHSSWDSIFKTFSLVPVFLYPS